MTADLQTQIFTTWLPLVVAVILALVGLLRGALREAILAGTVALAAFINSQWAAQWGSGLYGLSSSWPQQGVQFTISVIVLWATTLIVGYGLGSLLPRTPIPAWSRFAGGLFGLLSGAALAGWSLRYYITNTDGTLAPGVLLDTPVSRVFIIWATWFPLILALLGVIAVIVGPLRRMQGAVAQPTEDTNWTPASTARPPLSGASSTAPIAAVGAPGVSVPYAPPPQAARDTAPVPQYGYNDVSRTRSIPEVDAPPTNLLPAREASAYPGYTPPSGGPTDTTRITPSGSGDTGTYFSADTASSSDSSWLLQSNEAARSAGSGEPQPEAKAGEDSAARLSGDSLAAETASGSADAPTSYPPQETPEDSAAETDTAPPVTPAATAPDTKTCPNCGTKVASTALFCTNCGTRLP